MKLMKKEGKNNNLMNKQRVLFNSKSHSKKWTPKN